jgi:hypothetical protein
VTRALCALALVALLAGCGSNGDDPSASDGSRVEKCVERILDRAEGDERQATATCEQFARRSFVNEDGTLSIDVVRSGGTSEGCAAPRPQEPAPTNPCIDMPSDLLDCGLLDLVRRAEVQAYLEERKREGALSRCDDGRPPEELGAE